MRFTLWAFYSGDDRPRLAGKYSELEAAEVEAERIFDAEGASLLWVHDGDQGESVFALHEGRESALTLLLKAKGGSDAAK